MASRPLRVQHTRPPPTPVDLDEDEHLGRWLVTLVQDAAAKGGAPPTAVVLRDDGTLDLLAVERDLVADTPLPLLLAGLSRSVLAGRSAVAVGLIGRFTLERRGPGAPVTAPVLLAFLEWSDCRWVGWRRVLDAPGARPDGDALERALDGDPLPDGLGRWWSLGRRTGVQVTFGAARAPDAELVH
jgi:hypothetical protein